MYLFPAPNSPVVATIALWIILFRAGSLTDRSSIRQPAALPAADHRTHRLMAASARATDTPDALVRALYRSHRAGKGPFRAAGSMPLKGLTRTTVACYLSHDLTKLIWWNKQYTDTHPDDIGALDFDALYYAQDTDVEKINVAAPTYKEPGRLAEVTVTFRNGYESLVDANAPVKEIETLRYQLVKEQAGWRVNNIVYQEDSLLEILKRAVDNASR